ncbi:MAG: TM2 domain-containing protein [Pseudomonadota bacterium]
MPTQHKNKTFAALLAVLAGGLGVHRFYLRGKLDKLGLLHVCAIPLCGMIYGLAPHADWFFKILPMLLSYIAAFIEALVIGTTSDEQWDARHNAGSGTTSSSNWPLALLLVATLMLGATVVIATMARLFDLLYTGGAYG